jgi:hypothetical protein
MANRDLRTSMPPDGHRYARLRRQLTGHGLDRFTGMIAASGFRSGDSVVVGLWRDSPLGPFIDVMWVRPDGRRELLAPSAAVRDYVAGLYTFEASRVVPVRGGWTGRHVAVDAGPLTVRLPAGRRDWRSWLFAARPRPLRRSPAWLRVEDALVGPLGELVLAGAAGVRVAGRAPGGQREWYSIDDYRPLRGGSLSVDGVDAGPPGPLRADLGVGLSDFPSVPALVSVVTLVEPTPDRREAGTLSVPRS